MKRAICALILASTSVLGTATASYAAAIEYDVAVDPEFVDVDCNASSESDYAKACFESGGDQFWIRDLERDDMSVGVHWKVPGADRAGICRNKVGVAPVSEQGPLPEPKGRWQICDKNMPEDLKILIRVGRCDGDVHSCKKPGHYEDFTAWDSTTT